jgi:Protein of unknown function (DUF1566)
MGGWVTPAFAAARFIDEGNGTVEDTLTDLIWLKDANCFGPLTWQDALEKVHHLADDPTNTTNDCGLADGSVAGTWRVPDGKELQSLLDVRFVGPALSNAAGTDKWTENDAFLGVESAVYWTSTTYAGTPEGVYSIVLNVGHTFVDSEKSTVLVWPVRDRR